MTRQAPHNHLQRLAGTGIDAAAAQRSGQFEIRTNAETYLRDGHFDQDGMVEFFEQLTSGMPTVVFRSAAPFATWNGPLRASRT
jgi:hypothetical protein